MHRITIPRINNMHGHLRQDGLLRFLVPFAARQCGYYVPMGNTQPPIRTGKAALKYADQIAIATPAADKDRFKPIPTIKIREDTTPEIIREAARVGIKMGKLYPCARTTHADDGIKNYMRLCSVFEAMQECGMIAAFHPEHPNLIWDDAECEYAFWGIFESIYWLFSGLKMIWEHLSDTRVLPALLEMSNRVALTVTLHHMLVRDVEVNADSHNKCRPQAKRSSDREALRRIATSGNPKAILGLDDAPWDEEHKDCTRACNGCWTMPNATELLFHIFDEERIICGPGDTPNDKGIQNLIAFSSRNGARFYGLPELPGTITLEREPCTVSYGHDSDTSYNAPASTAYVPFFAGKTLNWRVVS